MNFVARALILLSLMFLCGCSSLDGCIDADDFGTIRSVDVNSNRPQGSTDYLDESGVSSEQEKANQVIKWQDTGIITNGQDLILRVEGGWCPFAPCKDPGLGGDSDPCGSAAKGTPSEESRYLFSSFPLTTVTNSMGLSMDCPFLDRREPSLLGEGQWFTYGEGLYILFQRPTDPNPNMSLSYMRSPVSPNLHLGVALSGDTYNSKSQSPLDPSGAEVPIQADWRVFMKVLDVYYYDNQGSYKVKFLSGFKNPGAVTPFEWVRREVETVLNASAEAQFKSIVSNDLYVATLYGCLTLYIAFTSFSYMSGIARAGMGDVILRLLKAAMIVGLISPQSWDFFSGTLFSFFLNSSKQIIGIMASGYYDPAAPFGFLDTMLWNQLYSEVVWNGKIQALFNAGGVTGIIWIVTFGLVLLYFTYIAIYAVALYLTCMIALTYLVIMFPIVFLAIFFSVMKNAFDAWVRQSTSWLAQSIMVFVVLIFFGELIFHEMHRVLGFKACKAVVFDVSFSLFSDGSNEDSGVLSILQVRMFVPGLAKKYKKIALLDLERLAWGTKRYEFCGTLDTIDVPPTYKKRDFRYIELPFLDPNVMSESKEDPASWVENPDVKNQRDYQRLQDILYSTEDGKFVDMRDIVVLILLTIVLANIFVLVDSLAQYLAIGGMSLSNTATSSMEGMMREFRQMAGSNKFVGALYSGTLGNLDKARNRIGMGLDKVEGLVDRAGDKAFIGRFMDKGVNALAKEKIQHEIDLRFVRIYQDALGGATDYVADVGSGVGRAAVKSVFTLSAPVMAATLTKKIGEGKGAKDLARDFGSHVANDVFGGSKYQDENFKEHMLRVLDRYIDHSGSFDNEEAMGRYDSPIRNMRDGIAGGGPVMGTVDQDGFPMGPGDDDIIRRSMGDRDGEFGRFGDAGEGGRDLGIGADIGGIGDLGPDSGRFGDTSEGDRGLGIDLPGLGSLTDGDVSDGGSNFGFSGEQEITADVHRGWDDSDSGQGGFGGTEQPRLYGDTSEGGRGGFGASTLGDNLTSPSQMDGQDSGGYGGSGWGTPSSSTVAGAAAGLGAASAIPTFKPAQPPKPPVPPKPSATPAKPSAPTKTLSGSIGSGLKGMASSAGGSLQDQFAGFGSPSAGGMGTGININTERAPGAMEMDDPDAQEKEKDDKNKSGLEQHLLVKPEPKKDAPKKDDDKADGE